MKVRCPKCKQMFSVADDTVQQAATCPSCSAKIRIRSRSRPAASGEQQEQAASREQPRPAGTLPLGGAAFRRAPASGEQPRPAATGKALWAAGGLGVVLLAAFAIVLLTHGRSTKQPKATPDHAPAPVVQGKPEQTPAPMAEATPGAPLPVVLYSSTEHMVSECKPEAVIKLKGDAGTKEHAIKDIEKIEIMRRADEPTRVKSVTLSLRGGKTVTWEGGFELPELSGSSMDLKESLRFLQTVTRVEVGAAAAAAVPKPRDPNVYKRILAHLVPEFKNDTQIEITPDADGNIALTANLTPQKDMTAEELERMFGKPDRIEEGESRKFVTLVGTMVHPEEVKGDLWQYGPVSLMIQEGKVACIWAPFREVKKPEEKGDK